MIDKILLFVSQQSNSAQKIQDLCKVKATVEPAIKDIPLARSQSN